MEFIYFSRKDVQNRHQDGFYA